MSEQHITHEIKLHRSLFVVLWVFALGLILNALPDELLISDARAELASSPTITLKLGEYGKGIDIDD